MTAASRRHPVPDLSVAIDRLRAIATESAEHLLHSDGPPHPDARLLDLCAEIGHQRRVADAALERRRAGVAAVWMCKTPTEAAEVVEAQEKDEQATKHYVYLLRRAAKIKAATPAGIYAKAIAVRSSKTGAPYLAMSLAEDLLACEGLRKSLWPVETGETE